jgi:hypothetical protein
MIPDILSDRPLPSEGMKYNNHGTITIVTDVETEPVSDAEAKLYCKVEHSEEDTEFTRLRAVAREQVEDKINMALAPKTIKVAIRNEKGNFKLPYWTSDATFDELREDDDTTVISASSYEIVDGVLKTKFSEIVYAEYETGFTACPAKYKQLILEKIGELYFNKAKSNPGGTWLI